MSEIKWIKINVNMTDNRKIKRIRRLPDGNNVVLFWVFLLTKAGESNKNGGLFFLEDMPYTIDDLAEEFDFTHDFVKFALKTLEGLKMVELFDDIIYIKNWEKYQSVEGMERVRKLNADRNKRYRERQKQLDSPKQSDVSVTSRDGTDKELDIDIDIYIVEIVSYLNDVANKKYRHTTPKTRRQIKARFDEGFAVDDFKKVIDKKVNDWKEDNKMNKYLRPETLFGTKFEGYLNEEAIKKNEIDWDEL